MSSGHEQHGVAGSHHSGHHGPRVLPATLGSPELITAWRTRAIIACVIFTLISLAFVTTHEGRNHLLRAYLMGYMTCFGFAGGGLAMLMLQYVSGGKWGLLLRRPLEAMTRTLPLVAVMLIPILALAKHLYQWALYPTADATKQALDAHWINAAQ